MDELRNKRRVQKKFGVLKKRLSDVLTKMAELRDKKDRDLTPDFGDGGLDVSSEENFKVRWLEVQKKYEELKKRLNDMEPAAIISNPVNVEYATFAPKILVDWEGRYNQIKTAYVKTRLEESGSFGNWDYNTRKRVLEKEISNELGFTI